MHACSRSFLRKQEFDKDASGNGDDDDDNDDDEKLPQIVQSVSEEKGEVGQ